jgi:predicted nucleic acid-binding protein
MADRTFFDTNVLVYAFDRGDPRRQPIAARLLETALAEGTAVVSLQVLQEFYVVVTRKVRTPIPPAKARSLVAEFLRHPVVEPTGAHVLRAIDLSIQASISFWDALIVTTAEAAGCTLLYTEDLTSGRLLYGVRLVDPFE